MNDICSIKDALLNVSIIFPLTFILSFLHLGRRFSLRKGSIKSNNASWRSYDADSVTTFNRERFDWQ